VSADAPSKQSTRLRELGQKLLALGVSLLFSFLVLEAYVRLTFQSQWHIPKSAVQSPGIFSARMKPDNEADIPILDGGTFHVKTNARGFRGPPVSTLEGKPLKVLSLGDSFMFGWGLALEDQTMWRFMDAYRRAHPERDVGHAYVACGSWDPKDYYFAYLTEASKAKPDLVVLGVFSGNDIMPNDAPRILDPGKAPVVDQIPEAPKPWIRSFDWVRAQLSGSMFVASFRAKHNKPAAFAPFENDLPFQRELWDTSLFYIGALAKAVKKDGGKLVVVLYPSMLQLNTPKALDDAGYDHTMPERLLTTVGKEHHLEVITLLDGLAAKNEKRDLYYPKDRHITARGSEVAAEILREKLAPIVDEQWAQHAAAAKPAAPAP
jgi:hypothetical protein